MNTDKRRLLPGAAVLAAGLLLTGCVSAVIGGGADTGQVDRGSETSGYADARLAAAIRSALYRDPALAGYQVQVRVRDGVASLSGVLPSESLVARAVSLARNTAGVTRVETRLRVDSL